MPLVLPTLPSPSQPSQEEPPAQPSSQSSTNTQQSQQRKIITNPPHQSVPHLPPPRPKSKQPTTEISKAESTQNHDKEIESASNTTPQQPIEIKPQNTHEKAKTETPISKTNSESETTQNSALPSTSEPQEKQEKNKIVLSKTLDKQNTAPNKQLTHLEGSSQASKQDNGQPASKPEVCATICDKSTTPPKQDIPVAPEKHDIPPAAKQEYTAPRAISPRPNSPTWQKSAPPNPLLTVVTIPLAEPQVVTISNTQQSTPSVAIPVDPEIVEMVPLAPLIPDPEPIPPPPMPTIVTIDEPEPEIIATSPPEVPCAVSIDKPSSPSSPSSTASRTLEQNSSPERAHAQSVPGPPAPSRLNLRGKV